MVDDLIYEITSIYSLNKAFKLAKRGKMFKRKVQEYNLRMNHNNYILSQRLRDGSYKPYPCYEFWITEPKLRHIQAPSFRDRLVQKSIVNLYLRDQLTKFFIKENCACQIGKGTDYARNLFKEHLRRSFRENGLNSYVLQIDIHSYFASIDGYVMAELNRKYVQNEWIEKRLAEFGVQPGSKGIGLGCETNQYEALLYLHPVDTLCKYVLGLKHYIRYMDDILIIVETKQEGAYVLERIKQQLTELKLELNEKKTKIRSVKDNTSFLGFRFHLTKTGKALMTIKPSNVSKERRKLRKQVKILKPEHFSQCFQSWKAHCEKGDNYKIVTNMEAYMNDMKKLRELEIEAEAANARALKAQARLEYVAMMTDVDLPVEEETPREEI